MKRTLKGVEPPLLLGYRSAVPNATWDQMRNDTSWNGQQAYHDCRLTTINNQNGLCAYCEINIRDNDPLKCRVEHFHSKSDTSGTHNWALDWNNMLAVCNGGSYPHTNSPGFYLAPTKANLSCDAHKDRLINSGALNVACEGWIMNPSQIIANPALFRIQKQDGHLVPDTLVCSQNDPWSGNQHATLEDLVDHTIKSLNLNCDRLAQTRLVLLRDIERNIKLQRKKGLSPTQGFSNLVDKYFNIPWPAFFTAIRSRLGVHADNYLQSINYQG